MLDEKIHEIFAYYEKIGYAGGQEEIIACLREIQKEIGCVPKELQEKTARLFGVKPTAVQAYIKLYPSLKERVSEHIVTVCTGPRCKNKGSQRLLDKLRSLPGVKDGRIEIRTQQCMHRCAASPNVRVDGELLEHIDFDELIKRLDGGS